MTIPVDARQGDRAGRFWMLTGWAAILFPVVFMTATGWDSGEHANVPLTVGLVVSASQGVVWTAIWLVRGRADARRRRMMFGVGAPLSLIGWLAVLAATQHSSTIYTRLALSLLAYLLIAAVAVWATKTPAIDRFPVEQR